MIVCAPRGVFPKATTPLAKKLSSIFKMDVSTLKMMWPTNPKVPHPSSAALRGPVQISSHRSRGHTFLARSRFFRGRLPSTLLHTAFQFTFNLSQCFQMVYSNFGVQNLAIGVVYNTQRKTFEKLRKNYVETPSENNDKFRNLEVEISMIHQAYMPLAVS
jgi:hypothetical protein